MDMMHGHRTSNRSSNGFGPANSSGLLVDLEKQTDFRGSRSGFENHEPNRGEKFACHGKVNRGRRARFGETVTDFIVKIIEWLRPKRRDLKDLRIKQAYAQSRWLMAARRFDKRIDEVLDKEPQRKKNGL